MRSRTGFVILLNSDPIKWFSRKQSLVETSAFGTKFVAAKEAVEYLRGLQYKLCMLGIPIDGYSFIYMDNQLVLKNVSIPQSNLNRESNLVAYHYVREATET